MLAVGDGGLLMRRLNTWVIASLLSFGPSLSGIAEPPSDGRATAASDSAWVPLFDGKSLRGWYPQIQNQKTGEDPAKFFQVDEGAIHVYKDQVAGTAVPNGYLATEAEYANYHLRMQYKWGAKKFKPRMMAVRDAGQFWPLRERQAVSLAGCETIPESLGAWLIRIEAKTAERRPVIQTS
jgi:hypothetical protein